MKISDVCAKTGLTDRAVRFYVEKGLLKKDAQNVNGRNCRNYSEQDVNILRDISVLRNMGFSIQEILKMQDSDENIRDIIEEKCIMLEKEYSACNKSILALEKVKSREGLTWRTLAGLLRNNPEQDMKEITFNWPEEFVEKKSDFENKNKIVYIFISVISAVIIIMTLFFIGQYNKNLVSVFTLSDVIFLDKWEQDGELYVKIICDMKDAIGYDNFFKEEKILRIQNTSCYETITCNEVFYSSVNVQVEMTYGEAKRYELLGEENESIINLEKILENEEWISSYCSVCRVSN